MVEGMVEDFGNQLAHHRDLIQEYLNRWSQEHERLLKQYLTDLTEPFGKRRNDSYSFDVYGQSEDSLNVVEAQHHGTAIPVRGDSYMACVSTTRPPPSSQWLASTEPLDSVRKQSAPKHLPADGEAIDQNKDMGAIPTAATTSILNSSVRFEEANERLHNESIGKDITVYGGGCDEQNNAELIEDPRPTFALPGSAGPSPFVSLLLKRGSTFEFNTKDNPARGVLQSFMKGKIALCVCSGVALANAIVITLSTQYMICIPTDVGCPVRSAMHWLKVSEVIFAAFFVIEFLARISVHGTSIFLGSDSFWYVVDSATVVSAVVSTLLYFVQGQPYLPNLSYIRGVRVVWFLWATPVGQILEKSRHLRLLRMLAIEATLGLAISMTIAIIAVYIFAVFIVQVVSGFFHMKAEMPASLHESLLAHWGSVTRAMLKLGMAVTGGELWSTMASPLWDVSFFLYGSFLVYICVFIFVIANLIAALFIQATMEVMNDARGNRVRMHMESMHTYIKLFKEAFETTQIALKTFKYRLDLPDGPESRVVEEFCGKLGISIDDVIHLLYCLSSAGSHSVKFEDLIITCIQSIDTPTKMDMVELLVKQERNLEDRLADASPFADGRRTIRLHSLPSKLSLEVREVAVSDFIQKVLDVCMTQQRHHLSHTERQNYFKTVQSLLNVVMSARGGGGFVVADIHVLLNLQTNNGVDFQVVDRDKRWPNGYMTTRLSELHVAQDESLKLLQDFTDHKMDEYDRWPEWHEASGLPKDGFTILDIRGKIKGGAVRLVGLPTPPYRWDNVGTRHLAALAAAWSLRSKSALVVVRSDSGKIHALCPLQESLVVFRARVLQDSDIDIDSEMAYI